MALGHVVGMSGDATSNALVRLPYCPPPVTRRTPMQACRVASSIIFASILAGCSGMRFVIDAVPSQDQLTESVVMEDTGGLGAIGKAKIAQIDVTGLIADADKPGLLSPGQNPL